MTVKHKIWLITGAVLILIGGMIFCGVMFMLKWDFSRLSTTKYKTNEYTITDTYKNISIETDTAEISLVAGDDSESLVICFEEEDSKHTVNVIGDTLTVKKNVTKEWYKHIGLNFGTPKITLIIPEGLYSSLTVLADTGKVDIPEQFSFSDINIKTSTGDIRNKASASGNISLKASTGKIEAEDISANSLTLSVTTGKVEIEDVRCKERIELNVSTGKATVEECTCRNLVSTGDTGDINLKETVAAGYFSINRTTGDIRLDECDAAELNIKTDTGNVKGTLLSPKTFVVTTDTGSIKVPKNSTGGKCEISTDTGDINIAIKNN